MSQQIVSMGRAAQGMVQGMDVDEEEITRPFVRQRQAPSWTLAIVTEEEPDTLVFHRGSRSALHPLGDAVPTLRARPPLGDAVPTLRARPPLGDAVPTLRAPYEEGARRAVRRRRAQSAMDPVPTPPLPSEDRSPPRSPRADMEPEEDEPITLVFEAQERRPPSLPTPDPATSCLVEQGNKLPVAPGNRWPGEEQPARNFPRSEGDGEWHESCNESPPARTEDDMAPQTFGIEYDVVDLEGDLDGSPARPVRHVPEEIAMLSGGLFDALPKVEVPLDTFFPAEYAGSPAWHRTRSDSLIPVASMPSEEAPARRVSPNWFVGIAAAAAMGMILGAVAQRPSAPAPATLAPAPAKTTATAPITEQATAIEGAAAPATPTSAPMSGTGTGSIPVKVAGAASGPPVVAGAASGLRSPSEAARALPVSAPAPAAPPAAPTTGTEPILANMPIAPPPPPVVPAPEVPPQQSTSVAVAAAARGAASCFAPDELRRTMAVRVTFAPSGRATNAVIEGGPHRATAVGSCIAQRLRAATVKPFEGPAITVHTSVHIR